ncbi:MAG: hypothetical protein IPN76_32425 [Saprospiraceae bacterium]|nr:hypothetical protein [Saprospiraceae bacterium]
MAGVSTLLVPFFPSIEAHIYTMFNSERSGLQRLANRALHLSKPFPDPIFKLWGAGELCANKHGLTKATPRKGSSDRGLSLDFAGPFEASP